MKEPSPARIVNLGEGSFGVEYSYGERPAPSWLTKEEPMAEKRKGPRKTAIRLLKGKMTEIERLPREEQHILQALTTVSMSIAAMNRSVEAYRRVQNNLLGLAAMIAWRSGDDAMEEAVERWYAHRDAWAEEDTVGLAPLTRAIGWAFCGWEHGYDADSGVPIIIALEWASRLEKAIRWMER